MSKFIVLLSLLAPFASHAETFSCSFTEPFVDFTYSTSAKTIVLKDAVTKGNQVYKHI